LDWTPINSTVRRPGDRNFFRDSDKPLSVYKPGHFGVSLLVWAPVGFALVLAGRADLAILGELAMVGLATLPDYDHRVPFIEHRGPTHTLAFALLIGGVLGGIGWLVGGQPNAFADSTLAVFMFGVGTLAICAHLLGDIITPAGIAPFWPLSSKTYSLYWTRADNAIANYGLLALGVFVTVGLLSVLGSI